ncbi:MAG TPA: hypothetical protein PKE19_00610 [Aestuariivirga sp.]|nr:hypothetical protein [Aestuariivirga sp.]
MLKPHDRLHMAMVIMWFAALVTVITVSLPSSRVAMDAQVVPHIHDTDTASSHFTS